MKTIKHSHHKIPKSRGGTDDEWNLVEMDPYTHAYEHALDFVLFDNAPMVDFRQQGWPLLPGDLQQAVLEKHRIRMSGDWNPTKKGVSQSTRDKQSELRKGVLKSPEHKEKIRQSNKRYEEVQCPHCSKKGREAQMKRWHFNNCRHFTGQVLRQPKATCPHCGITGSACNIKRYHFNNCKFK
jgi:hypothetical protein